MHIHKLPINDDIKKLAAMVAGDLTRNIYALLPAVQQAELENLKERAEQKKGKKKGKGKGTSRGGQLQSSRESRLIPGLIFQIEAFEQSLLALGELHGTVIIGSFHRSTARDFRIQLDDLEAALEQFEVEEESSNLDNNVDSPRMAAESNVDLSLVISSGAIM